MDGSSRHLYNTILKPKVHKELAKEIVKDLEGLETDKDKLDVLEKAIEIIKGYY